STYPLSEKLLAARRQGQLKRTLYGLVRFVVPSAYGIPREIDWGAVDGSRVDIEHVRRSLLHDAIQDQVEHNSAMRDHVGLNLHREGWWRVRESFDARIDGEEL